MNAIQHSPPRAQVELRVVTQNGSVAIMVQDHGDGIPRAALPHVFDRFYRGDSSRARATGGAGLGLAICKAAVEKAGGTIALASEPDQGTIASVQLPRA
jgi:signal transduction histidine kinase